MDPWRLPWAGAPDPAVTAVLLVAALLAGAVAARLSWRLVRRWDEAQEAVDLARLPTGGLERAIGVLFPLIAVALVLPVAPLPVEQLALVHSLLTPLLALSATWAVVAVFGVVEAATMQRWDVRGPDNLYARVITTRIRVARNLATFVVILVGLGTALMTIPQVRQLGTSLLASAGVAGIIIGFAAQRSIATLVAGIQIAFTQPIRIDDVVIVEGEWGRIEEITLTYVVVRIWDLRRLVVPITYFIEQPFQNWTRSSSELLATVLLEVDYRVPVDDVRAELRRILDETELYDGKIAGLQVVDCTDRTMRLRALMDAPDASRAWDLRCHVREGLLTWMQREHPDKLPRIRVEAEPPALPDLARQTA